MAKKPYEFVDLSLKKKVEEELESREERETKKRFKVCSKCKMRKSFSYFVIDRRSSDGRTGECKSCRSKQSLRYYYNNREKLLLQIKEYQETHKIDRSKYFENYQRDHKEHLQKIARVWYRKNRKRIKKRNLDRKASLK